MVQESKVKTIKDLLKKKLTIPDYQRPYKWQTKQVEQLLNDINDIAAIHKDKNISRYRIGTIVIHKDKENELNIVDGQQRITTLALIFHCLAKKFEIKLEKDLPELTYDHTTSQYNIQENYQVIETFITNLEDQESFKDFILGQCEVVYIKLDDIDEAFQFFDSQNARGKGLEGFDLLKAFHLRKMAQEKDKRNSSYEDEKKYLVSQWEAAANKNLKMVFDDLYAIRKWLRNERTSKTKRWDNGDFLKKDVNHFKGICIEEFDYPYLRKIQSPECLFEIDRPIFNGTLFFKYIIHYSEQLSRLEKVYAKPDIMLKEQRRKGEQKLKLSKALNSNETRHAFFTILYRRVLLFYYDKFGEYDFEKASKNCAIWSAELLKQTCVFYSAVQNLATKDNSFFKKIKNAIQTKDLV